MAHYPAENPNPNSFLPYHHHHPHFHQAVLDQPAAAAEFRLSDYLMLDEMVGQQQEEEEEGESSVKVVEGGANGGYGGISGATSSIKCKNWVMKKKKAEAAHRVAFRTKSELEVMDDGFKWRKYGKKSVKNSPYPRNYYKCSSNGCSVKKRVERDREDSRFVITTYDGVHNHESPSGASTTVDHYYSSSSSSCYNVHEETPDIMMMGSNNNSSDHWANLEEVSPLSSCSS